MQLLYTGGYKKRYSPIINCLPEKCDSVIELCFGDIILAEYCKKNKIHIVLPILFVINANCYRFKDSSNLIDPVNKATVNELAIKILSSQTLSLKQSFNQIGLEQKGKATNCIFVAPCTISSRLNKQKTMM